MIDKNSPIPLYLQLKEYIRDLIYTGHLCPESQLPTENEWMTKFKLGRATVRAALSELEHERLIYKRQGIGTFVSKREPDYALIPLISLTHALKAMGIETQNTVLQNKKISPSPALLKEMRCKSAEDKRYVLRIRAVKGHPIAVEHSYISSDIFESLKDVDLASSHASLLIEKANISLDKIDQTIITRMPTLEEINALKITKDESVLELTRWLYKKESQEPFSYVKFVLTQRLFSYPFGRAMHDI